MSCSSVKKIIRVKVPVMMFKEGDYFVAYCPALELSSYDKTAEEAKKAFEQALEIFIEETERRGTLERVLLSLGWTLKQKPHCRYEPPFLANKSALQAKAMRVIGQTVNIPCSPLAGAPAYAVHN
jgi:predicted RNase H-like HicB family nuclease